MNIAENTTLRSKKNKSYTLGKEIGAGGEGRVFEIPGQWLVAKIYKKVVGDIEEKITYMVDHPVSNLKDSDGDPYMKLAWPQDVLYDNTGAFVGYIMPFIEQGVGIFNIARGCDSPASKTMFPRYTRVHNVVAATNLARAVAHLHAHGYIIGDMNSQNILVGPKCCVIILDNDSFDITDSRTGSHYKCTAGTQEYLAPELQGRNLRDERARFTKESDNFSLAIHIFQLLMNNFHPFTGKNLVVNRDSSVNEQLENIQKGLCPFVRDIPNLAIPVAAPYLVEMVPPKLVGDFCQTFIYDETNVLTKAHQRVTAQQWVNDLSGFLQQLAPGAERVQCANDPTHIYISSLGKCGLCAAEERYKAYINKPRPKPQPPRPQPVPQPVPQPQSQPNPQPQTGSTTNYNQYKSKMDPGLKIFLWIVAVSIVLLLFLYRKSQETPTSLPQRTSVERRQDSDTPSAVTGNWEPDVIAKLNYWETKVYVLDEPIVGAEAMTIYYNADMDGDPCTDWLIYGRTPYGWEEIGWAYLANGTGSFSKVLTLDGTLTIDAIKVFPADLLHGGSYKWQATILVSDVRQNGIPQKVTPKNVTPQTQPSGSSDYSAQSDYLSGYWEMHTINKWNTSVWMLDRPIRKCTSFRLYYEVQMDGSVRCKDWRVYARVGNGSWRQIDTLTMTYDSSGWGLTDKAIYLDGSKDIDAIAVIPRDSGQYSYTHWIGVYDAK